MSSKNKKKATGPSRPTSPTDYFKNGQARKLPLDTCYVSENWQEQGLAQVIVSRRHVNGNITAAFFLVDILCVGVKDTHLIFNEPESEMQRMITDFTKEFDLKMEQCDYVVAHNVVYAGVDFAAEYNIEPCADFAITKMILEEDNDDIELMDIDCGEDGIPVLIDFGIDSRVPYYLKQLKKYAGEGNYKYVTKEEMEENEEEEFEEEEEGDDPESWEREDWASFFEDTASVEVINSRKITGYLYTTGILLPEAEKQGIDDLDTIAAEFEVPVTSEPLGNREYGNDKKENEEAEAILHIIADSANNGKALPDLSTRIRSAMVQWPLSPIFYNHLYNFYLLQDKNEEADAVMKEQIEKFPDYLFAKISFANRQIELGNIEAIPGIFNGCTNLAALYPSRTEFHISEFAGFITTYCFYYIHKDDLLRADCIATLLRELPDELFTNSVQKALNRFADYGIEKVNRLLTAVRNDATYREEVIDLLISE